MGRSRAMWADRGANRAAALTRLWRRSLAHGAMALAAAASLCAGPAHGAPVPSLAAWQQAIGRTPASSEGCFTADYPSMAWRHIACTVAPLRPYLPRTGGGSLTVGNGNDFAAVTAGLTTAATGSFPTVTGITKETNNGHKNEYSLQLNSNFGRNKFVCKGAQTPANCRAWQQFVFAETGGAFPQGVLFIQYWLINFHAPCPAGWIAFSSDCYRNSDSAVAVPQQKIFQLANLQLSGQARRHGLDAIGLVTRKKAYRATGRDGVVGLAKFWSASEFNVIGNGNGTQARFNAGTAMTVKIAVTDGTTAAPTCRAQAGTTAESNNLNLGKCNAAGGAAPFIRFTQSN